MNKEKIEKELIKGWRKAASFGGEICLHSPGETSANFAATTMISLLESTYIKHAISNNQVALEQDIISGRVQPWIVCHDQKPVACAALVDQGDGNVELGRAASIENGSGAGKIAMLSAVLNKRRSSIVAEVRLADKFSGIPGSEATQRICFSILELIPHAFLPAFSHGDPNRNELFGFSAENIKLINHSPILTAQKTIADRDTIGELGRLRLVQTKPFRVAERDNSGSDILSFVKESRAEGSGCTLVPIEVTDRNMGTISALLNNEFIISGLDRKLGPNNLPIIWLGTVGRRTLLAPTNASECLPKPTRKEIEEVARKFNSLAG